MQKINKNYFNVIKLIAFDRLLNWNTSFVSLILRTLKYSRYKEAKMDIALPNSP